MYQYTSFIIGMRFLNGANLDFFNKFVSYLSTISIALGVLSLITVISVMNGFENYLEKNFLQFIPQIIVTNKNNLINTKTENIKNKLFFPGVKLVTSIIIENVILQSIDNISIGTMIGINTKEIEPLEKYFINVKKKDLKENEYKVILGEKLANYLKVKKNDIIRIILPSNNIFTLIGRIPSQKLLKVIGTFSTDKEIDNYQILINQKDASNLLNYKKFNITGWRIHLYKPLNISKFEKYKKSLPKNFIWQDWRDTQGELFKSIKIEKNVMIILISLIILISIFNIITFIGLLILEKKEEIAILKTQGMNKINIMMIFIFQGLVSSILGSFIGTLLSILILKKINIIMPIINDVFKNITLPVIISPLQIICINIITIIIVILSIIYPACYASNLNPVKILKYE